jgi:D-3-phosphoglycerate dehydrogenase
MKRVFVSHPSDKLDAYFGAKATRALRGDRRGALQPEPRELSTAELVAAATAATPDRLPADAGPEALFRELPRCRVHALRGRHPHRRRRRGERARRAGDAGEPGLRAPRSPSGSSRDDRPRPRPQRATPRRITAASRRRAMGRELRGSTLGVIGLGRIGRTSPTSRLASACACSRRRRSRRRRDRRCARCRCRAARRVGLRRLPRAGQRRDREPARRRRVRGDEAGAFFVNAARGELVDDAALLAALDAAARRLRARRRPRARPDARPALARHPRVLATPHMGGLTRPAIEHQALETVAQLERLLRGELPPARSTPATRRAGATDAPT